MTKSAAEEWQNYDPEKPPETQKRIAIWRKETNSMSLHTASAYTEREEMRIGWHVQWRYINPPEPELLPCALHPDLKPIRTGATAEGVGCRDPHCCTMSNFELWNEMQEWLKGKTK